MERTYEEKRTEYFQGCIENYVIVKNIYISQDRQDLVQYTDEKLKYCEDALTALNSSTSNIDDTTAYWYKKNKSDSDELTLVCSNCKTGICKPCIFDKEIHGDNYCNYCGKRMDGVKDDK